MLPYRDYVIKDCAVKDSVIKDYAIAPSTLIFLPVKLTQRSVA
jgi:hypothetical protein|tara:strand:+ start:261 stop:389 length:129 start_codon:yes stop_codon:yes gene_type:complete